MTANDLDLITIASIHANAYSLLEQLADYSFLTITPEQSKHLAKIEKEFHDLRAEITLDKIKEEGDYKMKYQNGLRIYGIYIFEKYLDWTILLTDIDTTQSGEEYIEGLAFSLDGDFITGVSLSLPMNFMQVGYLLGYGHKLHLDKIKEV